MRTLVICILLLVGCSSISVSKLDTNNPSGFPFYLTKPMFKITSTTLTFFDIKEKKVIETKTVEEQEVVSVPDRNAAYTVNHARPLSGESKFSVDRTNGEISKIAVENKEGLTEFLKGLVEGAKTISEIAKEAPTKGAPAGAITESEASYFNNLLNKDIVVFKSSTIRYADIK
jgi:hypothetical protein